MFVVETDQEQSPEYITGLSISLSKSFLVIVCVEGIYKKNGGDIKALPFFNRLTLFAVIGEK